MGFFNFKTTFGKGGKIADRLVVRIVRGHIV